MVCRRLQRQLSGTDCALLSSKVTEPPRTGFVATLLLSSFFQSISLGVILDCSSLHKSSSRRRCMRVCSHGWCNSLSRSLRACKQLNHRQTVPSVSSRCGSCIPCSHLSRHSKSPGVHVRIVLNAAWITAPRLCLGLLRQALSGGGVEASDRHLRRVAVLPKVVRPRYISGVLYHAFSCSSWPV